MKRKRYREDAAKTRIMAEKKDLVQQNSKNELETNDLPQEITESYGTGVKDQPEPITGAGATPSEWAEYTVNSPGLTAADEDAVWEQVARVEKDEIGGSPELTGGDIDAAWELESMVGDEAVGGTAPTPDQDIVDEIGAAVGIEMEDQAFLRTTEILDQRDNNRWELDPKSSLDYEDRRD